MRIVERGGRRGKVSINLPLTLVRALGDAWPVIDWRCGESRRLCSLRPSEVLEALEAGQQLVEVENEDSVVRIWVE